VKGDELVEQDLWVSSATGKIVRSQEIFYSNNAVPDSTIDLGGRIISPGLIDVQLNGAFGFNFSTIPDDPLSYGKTLRQVNKSLIQTGVTSYLPTITSERKEVYQYVCHFPNDTPLAFQGPRQWAILRLLNYNRHYHISAHQELIVWQKMAPNLSVPTSKAPS
jgi:hypothetical protein